MVSIPRMFNSYIDSIWKIQANIICEYPEKCDNQESMTTDRRTDARQSDPYVSMCMHASMLRRRQYKAPFLVWKLTLTFDQNSIRSLLSSQGTVTTFIKYIYFYADDYHEHVSLVYVLHFYRNWRLTFPGDFRFTPVWTWWIIVLNVLVSFKGHPYLIELLIKIFSVSESAIATNLNSVKTNAPCSDGASMCGDTTLLRHSTSFWQLAKKRQFRHPRYGQLGVFAYWNYPRRGSTQAHCAPDFPTGIRNWDFHIPFMILFPKIGDYGLKPRLWGIKGETVRFLPSLSPAVKSFTPSIGVYIAR